jgi:ribosome-associated protein
MMNPDALHTELKFSTARSGGSGGQHVNKVETKVFLYFDVFQSSVLTPEQKQLLAEKLSNNINKEGVLVLSHDRKRSQIANKNAVIKKFNALMAKAFEKKKKRINTRPTKASQEARKKAKEKKAQIKKWRKPPSVSEH